MVPYSSISADAEVDKESGTCSSVSLCLRAAAAQTARPATSIATLRCETLSEQVRQRLTDALTHNRPTPPAPALIGESGQQIVHTVHALQNVHTSVDVDIYICFAVRNLRNL